MPGAWGERNLISLIPIPASCVLTPQTPVVSGPIQPPVCATLLCSSTSVSVVSTSTVGEDSWLTFTAAPKTPTWKLMPVLVAHWPNSAALAALPAACTVHQPMPKFDGGTSRPSTAP